MAIAIKSFKYLIVLLFASVWCGAEAGAGAGSITEWLKKPADAITYSSMPDLFALDHYQRCLSRAGGAYCVLDLHLANVPGELYNYIMEYSSVTRTHYNYTRLHRGVCVSERCALDHETALIGTELLSCLNRTLLHESGVQVARVKVHYCNTADAEVTPPDVLDIVVAAIMALLLVLAISGTCHHLMLRAGLVKENRYAMAFSVVKNWDALKADSSSDSFKCLQGMRFFTMIIVTGIHAVMALAFGYTVNPEFIERSYEDPVRGMMVNVRVVVQTFFVMSGFLLAHQILKDFKNKPFSIRDVPGSVCKRYLRLFPTEMVAVGLMATWVPRLGSGPLWDLHMRREQVICRANWWRQIFFIQNYAPMDKICLLQTWFLAADMQLHLLGLLVLVKVNAVRGSWRAWSVFAAVLTVSLSLPALQTYIFNMIPFRASLSPEMFLTMFEGNSSSFKAYTTIQANWTGYTLGMVTAYVHYQAQQNNWDLHNSVTLKRLYYLSLPVALCALWAGAEFHTRPASRLEAVLFNALDHNVFAAAMCVFILGCIYKCDRLLRACVEWAPIQPLGKLSFCALLVHIAVLWTYVGHLTSMQHGSVYNILFVTVATTALTYVLSVALFLLVEQPSHQLQKILFNNKTSVTIQHNGHYKHLKSQ